MSTLYPTAASHIPADQISATCRITVPGYVTTWHQHDEFMFLLPRRGALTLQAEGHTRTQRVAADLLAVVSPRQYHQTVGNAGEHCHIAVYVEKDFVSFCARKANGRLAQRGDLTFCAPTPALLGALHLHDLSAPGAQTGSLPRYRADLVDRLIASACVEAALGATPGQSVIGAGTNADSTASTRQYRVDQIKHFLDTTLSQRLDIDTVALEFGMSRRHLTRVFRDETGESIVGYLTRRRVERAAALLRVPGTTVLSAAISVGIDSPSYLARLFVKHGLPLPGSLK
jgi:AraC-like DNA-binding protein